MSLSTWFVNFNPSHAPRRNKRSIGDYINCTLYCNCIYIIGIHINIIYVNINIIPIIDIEHSSDKYRIFQTNVYNLLHNQNYEKNVNFKLVTVTYSLYYAMILCIILTKQLIRLYVETIITIVYTYRCPFLIVRISYGTSCFKNSRNIVDINDLRLLKCIYNNSSKYRTYLSNIVIYKLIGISHVYKFSDTLNCFSLFYNCIYMYYKNCIIMTLEIQVLYSEVYTCTHTPIVMFACVHIGSSIGTYYYVFTKLYVCCKACFSGVGNSIKEYQTKLSTE